VFFDLLGLDAALISVFDFCIFPMISDYLSSAIDDLFFSDRALLSRLDVVPHRIRANFAPLPKPARSASSDLEIGTRHTRLL